jgi:AhpD family alkylhydroperoxidase
MIDFAIFLCNLSTPINSTMFKVPAYHEVSDEAKTIFDQMTKSVGKMPNLYATIAYSGNALHSYIAYTQAQAKGTFHGKEREAVYLIVSELNGCEYCLASHTQSAMKFGWKEEETLLLRAGKIPDSKWQAIYGVIQSIIAHRGEVSNELLSDFYAQGFNEAALMDLMVLVSVMSFTNYAYRLTKIPIDFPLAKKI